MAKGESQNISFRRTLFRVSPMLGVPGAMAICAAAVAAAHQSWSLFAGYVGVAVLSAGLMAVCRRLGINRDNRNAFEGMVSVSLAWVVVCAIGTIPFLFTGAVDDASEAARVLGTIDNAWFESVSAFTSCGLTMSKAPQDLPASLQLWRSMAQWVGGLGMTLFAYLTTHSQRDNPAEVDAEWSADLGLPLQKSVTRVASIYGALTLLSVGMFIAVGMPAWEAVNHGLTAIATGGMTITGSSFQDYSSAILVAGMFVMMLGATSMVAFNMLAFRRSPERVVHRTETRLLWGGAVLGGTIIIALRSDIPFAQDGIATLFNWVSALTTAGFSAAPLDQHAPSLLILFGLAMLVGGESGSTVGGIKLYRAAWLGKAVVSRVLRSAWAADRVYTFNGDRFERDDAERRIQKAASFAGLWLAVIVVASLTLKLSSPDAAFVPVLFDSVSALGGVGLSLGYSSATLSAAQKIVLTILMWAGRLEIFAVLALLALPFRSRVTSKSKA